MSTRLLTASLVIVVIVALGACGKSEEPPKGKVEGFRQAAVVPTTTPMSTAGVKPVADTTDRTKDKIKDKVKGDKQDADWVPNEHKSGSARWKDTGVYVDGKPVGFLAWGELPIKMPVTWIKDKVSDRKRPGTNDPGWKWTQQRFYKFTDYLKAVKVDLNKVKEIHVYGPRLSNTLVATGADLRSPKAEQFMFRFGANTYGKPIPHAPGNFGNGKVADKIAGVMIYIDKKPPKLIRNEGLELDGQMVTGVPYYGDPIRGGVRMYLDDRLAAIIKRQELDPKKATTNKEGEQVYKIADVLAAQGVDTKKLVEAWVIRDERREEKIPAAEFLAMTFTASAQAHGGVLLGDKKIKANAIALHTRAVSDKEIPRPIPEYDD